MKDATNQILQRLATLMEKKVVDWDAVERTVNDFPDINEYDGYDTPLSLSFTFCGHDRGENMIRLVRLFLANGYDLSANEGKNGTEVLNGLCWSTYDETVTDAAKLLLDLGADPKIAYKENGEADYEKNVYGTIDWKLSGLWVQGYYDTANIFESYRQILDAYREERDYHRIRCYSDCCGHTLRKVEFLPDSETWGTLAETYPEYDGSLVFWFDDLPLVVKRYVEFSVNPFYVEDAKEPLTDISSRFSEIIGARLEQIVFIDTLTAKLCFDNGLFLLVTAEHVNENVTLSFFEVREEQPFPDFAGMEVNRVIFPGGIQYAPDCTQFTEESVGLLCGDRAFLLWSETDGGQYDDHWFSCVECSPKMLPERGRYLDLPNMKVERLFQHNHHKTGMRLSCGGKYLYCATDYFNKITLSLTDVKINSHKALFASRNSEHLTFVQDS